MYVRWLGAYKKNGSIGEAVAFEMQRSTDVACEQLQRGVSMIQQSRLGLLVDPKAVYRRYDGDVYSLYSPSGKLHPTRKGYEACSKHKESFAHPVYTGIVIKNGSLMTLSTEARDEVIKSARAFNLPIYRLVKGKLIEEVRK